MEDIKSAVDNWSKWIIIKRMCIAFIGKKSFRRVDDLWRIIGEGVQRGYFSEVLKMFEREGFIEMKKDGDIKEIHVLDLKGIKIILRGSRFWKEVKDLDDKISLF